MQNLSAFAQKSFRIRAGLSAVEVHRESVKILDEKLRRRNGLLQRQQRSNACVYVHDHQLSLGLAATHAKALTRFSAWLAAVSVVPPRATVDVILPGELQRRRGPGGSRGVKGYGLGTMLIYLGAACAVTLALWSWVGDADFSTLFAYYFLRGLWPKYRGKVVWITGGSSGIGEQLAYIFARLDSKIVISGTRHKELERVRNRCETISEECDVLILQGNITDFEQHLKWVKTVATKYGTIDVLINNAGRSQRSEFVKIPMQIERELFDVNVFGMISLTRQVLKYWAEQNKVNGQILVTSSAAGKWGAPFSATYNASKHALHGYFETLRSEMQVLKRPISITIACPGPVRSNLRVTAYTDKIGETYNRPDPPKEQVSLMDTTRCARLMVAGLASGLDELWIARQPVLIVYYLAQYMPSIYHRWLLPLIMNKNTMKIRDGK
ncbi:dehydrogenase/reductase SDR family member 7-like [Tropilaelaps mercedesae]|uniref:Dehydrogenase/reductase SDR family member 7-like n=1 Tax=Tropilaelaps mercedesae TaxID=418985 RepID=A0A1V9XK25_9ACAR|nr:dehydrogenase/reductase SDR family member 7-like [Tropilaelaps mercedesae]